MNPRRVIVEDRVLAIADRLEADEHTGLAGRLREVVPDTFGNCDEHVGMLRAALTSVAQLAPYAADCARVLAALDDLPRFVGHRGRVWVSHDGPSVFTAYWEEEDWLEQGPRDASLEDVLVWAALRSTDIRMPEDAR